MKNFNWHYLIGAERYEKTVIPTQAALVKDEYGTVSTYLPACYMQFLVQYK